MFSWLLSLFRYRTCTLPFIQSYKLKRIQERKERSWNSRNPNNFEWTSRQNYSWSPLSTLQPVSPWWPLTWPNNQPQTNSQTDLLSPFWFTSSALTLGNLKDHHTFSQFWRAIFPLRCWQIKFPFIECGVVMNRYKINLAFILTHF